MAKKYDSRWHRSQLVPIEVKSGSTYVKQSIYSSPTFRLLFSLQRTEISGVDLWFNTYSMKQPDLYYF